MKSETIPSKVDGFEVNLNGSEVMETNQCKSVSTEETFMLQNLSFNTFVV